MAQYLSAIGQLDEKGEYTRPEEVDGFTEEYLVLKELGLTHLRYKINAVEMEGRVVTKVEYGQIPEMGSLSTPHAKNFGKTAPGWRIHTVLPSVPAQPGHYAI